MEFLKAVPKKYACVICERKQYTNEKCYGCEGKIFISLESKEEKKMNFSDALNHLKKGYKVSREGWNGKGMYVFINKNIEDIEPFFVIRTVHKTYNTWVPSVSDLLVGDWQLL